MAPPGSLDRYPNDQPFQGCYSRQAIIVDLGWTNIDYNDDLITQETCSTACQTAQPAFTYFGISYGRDCWCGDQLPPATVSDGECTYPNAGAPLGNEIGGSNTAFTVWLAGTINNTPGTTDDIAGANPASYLGCWATIKNDPNDPRPTFGQAGKPVLTDASVDHESCQTYCDGYKYFAITGGNICQCDNSYAFGDVDSGAIVLDPSECNLRAAGDNSQAGGGPLAYTVYENDNYAVRPSSPTLCSKLCSVILLFDPG
ncbi:WSC domain-containing protein [Stagonosporopsis vannaccii]|nr:WSC domain-containing protein [Stagonosporopsis vannaccii]